ncbi:MAG: tetratricopeptide repeat protein [Vampirovibrio sp.]
MSTARFIFHLSPIRFYSLVLALLWGIGMGISAPLYAATPEAEALYAQAMQAYQQKALVKASELFQKSTAADPTYVDAWFNLGAVHYRLNQFEDARLAFQKALWRSPADAEIRYNLGMSLSKLNRSAEALEQLEKVPTTHAKYNEALTEIALLKKGGVKPNPSTSVATRIKDTTPVVSKPSTTTKPTVSTVKPAASSVNAVAISSSSLYAKGLVGPTGLTMGSSGELYVANYTKNNIVKVLPNGTSTVLVQGGVINGPIGLVRDPRNGNLYVANYISGDIVSVAPNGKTTILKRGYGKPYYLYFDSLTNRLFVSEQEGNQISVIKL